MGVDIEKLEALSQAATPGPWWSSKYGAIYGSVQPDDIFIGQISEGADIAYIVAACNAVPKLIARVRELEKALIEVVKLEVPLPECAVCWDKDKCADRTHGDNCLTIQDIINVAKEAVRTNKQ